MRIMTIHLLESDPLNITAQLPSKPLSLAVPILRSPVEFPNLYKVFLFEDKIIV